MHVPSVSPNLLPDRLQPYVTEQKLVDNAAAYPEMQRELTELEQQRVQAVKEHLLTVPLVHTFDKPDAIDSMRQHGLQPHAVREGNGGGHTHTLDQSLGLDTFAFMHWGELGREQYGRHHVLIAASATMLEHSIVTPTDIATYIEGKLGQPFEALDEVYQDYIRHNYFDKMVRGGDWLEIMARRAEFHLQYWPHYSLASTMHLGEVKFPGTVPPDALGAVIDESDPYDTAPRAEFHRQVFDNGLVPFELVNAAFREAPTNSMQDLLSRAAACWRRVLPTEVAPPTLRQ